jgi:hypothetical protein
LGWESRWGDEWAETVVVARAYASKIYSGSAFDATVVDGVHVDHVADVANLVALLSEVAVQATAISGQYFAQCFEEAHGLAGAVEDVELVDKQASGGSRFVAGFVETGDGGARRAAERDGGVASVGHK